MPSTRGSTLSAGESSRCYDAYRNHYFFHLSHAMRAIAEMGRWPLAALGFGLIAYGIYELINARYRRIQVA